MGGEPTLYKHWIELANLIHSKGHIVQFVTNLSIKNKTLLKKIDTLKPKKVFHVSWHPQFVDVENMTNNIKTLHERNILNSVTILADKRYWDKVKQ